MAFDKDLDEICKYARVIPNGSSSFGLSCSLNNKYCVGCTEVKQGTTFNRNISYKLDLKAIEYCNKREVEDKYKRNIFDV